MDIDIKRITLKKLTDEISNVSNNVWIVYLEENPIYSGTLQDCCDWISSQKKPIQKVIDPYFMLKNELKDL